MSSTLGAGVLATAIAVPVVLIGGSSTSSETPSIPMPPTTPTPPKKSTPEEIAAAIAGFNALTKEQKIAGYNKFVNDNSRVIVPYFREGIGMGKFYDANVFQPISTTDLPNTSVAQTNFNKLRSRLSTSGQLIIGGNKGSFNALTGFLTIKGAFNTQDDTAAGPGLGGTNFGGQSFYCSASDAIQISDPNFMVYYFVSPAVSSISNVTLNNDYSINMTLTDQAKNISFYLQNANLSTQKSLYKSTLVFNNETLFPNMTTTFATQVLKLVL